MSPIKTESIAQIKEKFEVPMKSERPPAFVKKVYGFKNLRPEFGVVSIEICKNQQEFISNNVINFEFNVQTNPVPKNNNHLESQKSEEQLDENYLLSLGNEKNDEELESEFRDDIQYQLFKDSNRLVHDQSIIESQTKILDQEFENLQPKKKKKVNLQKLTFNKAPSQKNDSQKINFQNLKSPEPVKSDRKMVMKDYHPASEKKVERK